MSEHDDEPQMVMPFVAGWEMATIAARLKAAKHHGLGLPGLTIHRPNLAQLDLVAMEIGATVIEEEWPDHLPDETRAEWARVRLEWAANH